MKWQLSKTHCNDLQDLGYMCKLRLIFYFYQQYFLPLSRDRGINKYGVFACKKNAYFRLCGEPEGSQATGLMVFQKEDCEYIQSSNNDAAAAASCLLNLLSSGHSARCLTSIVFFSPYSNPEK